MITLTAVYGARSLFRLSAFGACLFMTVAAVDAGCKNPQTINDVTQVALTVEQAACVLAQVELGSDEPLVVSKFCEIPPTLFQQIVSLITSAKRGKALALAGRHDSGIGVELEGGK